MSGISGSQRFTAVLAALVFLLTVPLSSPAFAGPTSVHLYVVLDSPEVLTNLNGSEAAPSTDTAVTFEVLDAATGLQVAFSPQVASLGVASASFNLDDGEYKIKVTADGFLENWYTSASGSGGDGYIELLRYQERATYATADVILVDSVAPDTSSWDSEGWMVLHRWDSSISGVVGTDFSGQQGSMLAGVPVELYDEASTDPDAGPVAETQTEAYGYYTFAGQPAGSYKVRFLAGIEPRWWPETPIRAEAEAITLTGANNFNLAYAMFPERQEGADAEHFLTLTGEPALGATLTAVPSSVQEGPPGVGCLERYSWFIDGTRVDGAFGPTFVVPANASGEPIKAQLNTAGIGCIYRELESNDVGPIDPGLTLPGTGIVVAPVDTGGGTDITLSFGSVTTAGNTTVTRLESGDQFPDGGFSSLTEPPLYYDIATTAGFDPELGAEVCITFDTSGMNEALAAEQHLYHYVNGAWADITVRSSLGVVCGLTSSFSPFAVGQPRWPFRGFMQPVDNGGILNAMKAGSAVPIKFGLGGNRGLDILAAGAPSSSVIACPGGTAPDDIEQTVTAGSSSLSYSTASDIYTLIWKTQKTWAGTCRHFELRLNDGTLHTALFDFRK